MQIIDNKLLLIKTRQPDKYNVIPKSKIVSNEDGVYEVAIHWGLQEARVLKNLGVKNVPAPIIGRYNWPGRFKPMSHQVETAAFLTMNRRAFCFSEPGTGKTMSALWALDYLMERKEVRRVLVLCPLSIMQAAWMQDIGSSIIHRTAIVAHHAQSSRRAEMIAKDYEIVVMNYEGMNIMAPSIIKNGKFDLIVVDECFVAGTRVSTPNGYRPIEDMASGDLVHTSNGVMPIQCCIRNTARRLVRVKTNHGKHITCTPDHPFFTDAGWVTAENLSGRRLVSFDALRHVQLGVSETKKQCVVALGERGQRWHDLLTILRTEEVPCGEPGGGLLQPHETRTPWEPLGDRAFGGIQGEHVAAVKGQGTSAKATRGQWNRDDIDGALGVRAATSGVGMELPSSVGGEARRLSHLLQTGLRRPNAHVGVGSGWQQSLHDGAQSTGYQEDGEVGATWVAGVTYIECDSETPVYNLRVAGTPNYFVEGCLVHNCNAYKNPATRRWKALASVIKPDTYLWMMTGTPAAQSPMDAFGLARLVNPNSAPKFMTGWRDKVMDKITTFKWAPKASAKDTVFKVLQPAIRFTKAQCMDLPPVVTVTRHVEMTAQQNKYYKQLKEQLLIEAEGTTITAVNAGVAITKLLQISAGAALGDVGEVVEFDCAPRLNVLLEILQETDRKVIIFAMFRASIVTITDFLNSQGIGNAQIHGGVAANKRGTIISDFQTTDTVRVLVMQPQATAHGITLTAADTVIFYGPLMSVELYSQAIARADRKGQTSNKVTVVHIESSPIEKKMFKAMNAKVDAHMQMVEMFDSEINI
jgi:superfamily II DNA or RNA helicase